MKRKQILFTVFVVVLLTGIGAFAKHSETLGRFFESTSITHSDISTLNSKVNYVKEQQNIQKENLTSEDIDTKLPENISKQPLSDEIAFDMFFMKVVSLEKTAARAVARGESGRIWSNYLQREGFTDNEIAVIRQIAKEHAAAILPIQARAVQIIKNGRAALSEGKTLPPAPPELAELQQQRNTIVIRNKTKLQNQLGVEAVVKAKLLMQKNSTSLQVDPSNLLNSEDRINEFKQKRNNPVDRKEGNRNE